MAFVNIYHARVFSSGQSEVLARASSSRPDQQEGKKQVRIPRSVKAAFIRWRWSRAEVHSAQRSLHPRKRRNTERGPEAGVRGASPGVLVRRTGGGMCAYTEGVYPYTEGGLSPTAALSVCERERERGTTQAIGQQHTSPLRVCLFVRRVLNCTFIDRPEGRVPHLAGV